MRVFSLVFLAATVAAAQTPTANFSGKWQIDAPAGRGGRGGGAPQILVINQVGNEVTGELGGGRGNVGSTAPVTNELWDGKVSGNSITFYVWRGNDRPTKTIYKGELNSAGDQITFKVVTDATGRGGAAPPAGTAAQGAGSTQEVVAKRAR
jgi:hypothetical protein